MLPDGCSTGAQEGRHRRVARVASRRELRREDGAAEVAGARRRRAALEGRLELRDIHQITPRARPRAFSRHERVVQVRGEGVPRAGGFGGWIVIRRGSDPSLHNRCSSSHAAPLSTSSLSKKASNRVGLKGSSVATKSAASVACFTPRRQPSAAAAPACTAASAKQAGANFVQKERMPPFFARGGFFKRVGEGDNDTTAGLVLERHEQHGGCVLREAARAPESAPGRQRGCERLARAGAREPNRVGQRLRGCQPSSDTKRSANLSAASVAATGVAGAARQCGTQPSTWPAADVTVRSFPMSPESEFFRNFPP